MKKKGYKKSLLIVMCAVLVPIFIASFAYAEGKFVDSNSAKDMVVKTQAEIAAYWTADAMKNAIPYPLPTIDASEGQPTADVTAVPLGKPGLVEGTLPGKGAESSQSWVGEELQYTPPGNWVTSYPGPFQRWTWFGRYTTYPTATIGKLFFTQNGINYVCSGSVVYGGGPQHDLIATAGHCVNDGSGNWSYNVQFCPSYNPNGVNPARGCWTADNLWSFTAWTVYGEAEADVGCIVAHNTGTLIGNHIGNVTGTLGRAWNWGADEPEFSFGYPVSYPFGRALIVVAAGPEWYTYNWGGTDVDGSPLADSKYMGNDMTGGASGGPWILGLGHPWEEFPDSDSNNATDPIPNGQGFLNGVNSHKIVSGGVLRTQEMGSAQFTNSHPDTEGLWSTCQSDANFY